MSCRVLGRGIETAFVKHVMTNLRNQGIKSLIGLYIPTEKNGQVKDFWTSLRFSTTGIMNDGRKAYAIDLEHADTNIKDYYTIN